MFWPLVTAISEQRLCAIQYRSPSATGAKRYRVLPLKMFVHDAALYLHALVPRHGDVVVLNLQRLDSLKVLKVKGTRPKDYDPSKWEDSSFGVFRGGSEVHYRLRFTPKIAPFIRERRWHPSQRLRSLKNGGVQLSFRCSESPEVTGWVASWRDEVTVLEPASLREQFRTLGAWLTEVYAAD